MLQIQRTGCWVVALTWVSLSVCMAAVQSPYPGAFLPLEGTDAENPVWHSYHPSSGASAVVSDAGTVLRTATYGALFVPRGYGRGESMQPPGVTTAIKPEANWLRIERTQLSELIENREEGFKQTFFVHQPPAGEGVLRFEMAVFGDLAIAQIDATSVRFSGAGGEMLAYEELLVLDAAGRELPARFAATGRAEVFAIEVEDTGAVYPVAIDPLFRPEANTRTTYPWPRSSNLIQLNQPGTVIRLHRDLCFVGVPGYRLFPKNRFQNPELDLRDERRRLLPAVFDALTVRMTDESWRNQAIHNNGAGMLKAIARMMYYVWNDPIEEVGAVFLFRLYQGEWSLYDVLERWEDAIDSDIKVRHDGYPATEQWQARFGSSIAVSDAGVMIGEPGRGSFDYQNYSYLFKYIVRWSGPHKSGTVHFYNRPADGEMMHRVAPYLRRINSQFRQPFFTGDFYSYREAGHVVAISDDHAVTVSGPSFNPGDFLSMASGYGPSKLHHFRRDGQQGWRLLPDYNRDNDFAGQVIGLEILDDWIYVLERVGGLIHLSRVAVPTSPMLINMQSLASWADGGNATLARHGKSFVVGLPGLNRFVTFEITGGAPVFETHEGVAGETGLGGLVAHAGAFLYVTSLRNGSLHLNLWQREADGWEAVMSEPTPPLWSMDADPYTLALTGPRPGNEQFADVRLKTYNRSISGTVYTPQGQPFSNAWVKIVGEELRLEPSGTLQGRSLGRELTYRFFVPDHIRQIDYPLLQLELHGVPTNMVGSPVHAFVRLQFQTMLRVGTTDTYYWGQPSLGFGRSALSNGVVNIPLWEPSHWEPRYSDEADNRRLNVAGEWEVRLTVPFGTGTGSFGTISNATLRLVYGPHRTPMMQGLLDFKQADASGNFHFDNIPPGRHRIEIGRTDYQGSTASLDLSQHQHIRGVRLDTQGNLTYRMRLVAHNGDPLAGVSVVLTQGQQ